MAEPMPGDPSAEIPLGVPVGVPVGILGGLPGRVSADRLADLRVIVDGSGPLVDWTVSALRACGVLRVASGAYAVEQLGWEPPPTPRRDHRVRVAHPLSEVAAIVAVRPGRIDPHVSASWVHHGILHLPVEAHPDLLQVGPLVIPGVSACLTCRHRRVGLSERDPWSNDDVFIGGDDSGAQDVDPGVGVLAAAIAALTVRQALLGDHSLAGVSCDVVGPRPEIVHRYWAASPDCSCHARDALTGSSRAG